MKKLIKIIQLFCSSTSVLLPFLPTSRGLASVATKKAKCLNLKPKLYDTKQCFE